MLNSFSLSNFKAFGSEQNIPLRPITLIFGANSAGKSSILHSLLLARHALDTGNWDVTHPKIAGDSVELGGFANYLHQKGRNPAGATTISFDRVLGSDFRPLSQLLPYSKKVRLTLNIAADRAGKAMLRDCRVDVDDARLFLLTPKSDGQMGLNVWETSHSLSEKLITWALRATTLPTEALDYRETVVREMVALQGTATLEALGFLPKDIRFEKASLEGSSESPDARLCTEVHRLFTESVSDILTDLHDMFASELRSLEYLGPLRSYPQRHFIEDANTDPNWYAGGGFAWQVVQQDSSVRNKVNDWLGSEVLKTRYKLEVDHLIHETSAASAIPDLLRGRLVDFVESMARREERGTTLLEEIGYNEIFANGDSMAAYLTTQGQLLTEFAKTRLELLKMDTLLKEQEPEYYERYDILQAQEEVLEDFRFETAPEFLVKELTNHFLNTSDAFGSISSELWDVEGERKWFTDALIKGDRESRSELRLLDLRTNTVVTHRDVGIGISQVLPVLVHAFGSKNKLIAIEQPEIHLHPALQAELGDLFIESALGENRNHFILETHSEHLILRLLRRVRDTSEGELEEGKRPLIPSDLCVLFVEPSDTESRVIELPVTPDGDFRVPWPGGFFAERATEIFGPSSKEVNA